ncbi:hypothetical protein KCP76_07480 [Salmonella enterica subsp. enterica serovar Weltevreden]|nr:hypothetical protein KCP76_07480 [Salmonella enterica subsp. enterica serovar Weltevreden]
MRKYGLAKVYYGDATQAELLRSAARKRRIDTHVYEPEDTQLVALCQQHFPHSHILRERDACGGHELLQAGVTQFPVKRFPARWNWDVNSGVVRYTAPGAQRAVAFSPADMRKCCGADPEHKVLRWRPRAREALTRTGGDFFSAKCTGTAPVGCRDEFE